MLWKAPKSAVGYEPLETPTVSLNDPYNTFALKCSLSAPTDTPLLVFWPKPRIPMSRGMNVRWLHRQASSSKIVTHSIQKQGCTPGLGENENDQNLNVMTAKQKHFCQN